MTHSIRKFLEDETGAVTIEFTTLVVAFVAMLVFFADASIIYLTRTEMWSVARDISRKMSVGEITDEATARDYAAAHLFLGQRDYQIAVSDVDATTDLTVQIAVSVSDAAIFGAWFKPVLGRTLVANVTMEKEPAE